MQFECGRQGRVFTKIQRSTLANIWPWQQNKVLESDTLDLDKSIYQGRVKKKISMSEIIIYKKNPLGPTQSSETRDGNFYHANFNSIS